MNPEDIISPIVVNSKKAQEDYSNIQAKHSDIVRGISEQAIRVGQYNQQREVQRQAEQSMKMEQDKQMRESQTANLAKQQEMSLKQQELDIKAKALTL